jgi:hypothetical protein
MKDYPLSQGDALKLIERLVWRAAPLKKLMDGALTAASLQVGLDIYSALIMYFGYRFGLYHECPMLGF